VTGTDVFSTDVLSTDVLSTDVTGTDVLRVLYEGLEREAGAVFAVYESCICCFMNGMSHMKESYHVTYVCVMSHVSHRNEPRE